LVELFENKANYKVIGTRPVRHDGVDKVTGRAVYGADVKVPGLIWGEVLRSTEVHAKIKSIDTSDAEKFPGVIAVMTHDDLATPGRDTTRNGLNDVDREFFNIMAKDKVMYKGHVVAAVAAIDRNTAQEAVRKIKVEYEKLPAVTNVDDAIAKNAPILLEDLIGDHLGEEVKNTNIATHFRHEFGNVEEGFESADLIVDKEVSLQMVHQGYIEPHNATAIWSEDDKVTVWSSTQGSFGVRDQTAKFIGVSPSSVRVNYSEIGGGFGGKTKVYLSPIAAILSKKSNGRPVKIVMDRPSVFQATGPAPGGKVRVKMGVTNEGKITAAHATIRYEAGAYPGSAVNAGAICIFACYEMPASRIDGFDIVVNKPKSAAYRAPGSPQAAFAIETVVDEICDQKGWDKIQFRLDNAAKKGTRRGDGVLLEKIGFEESLKAAQKSEHWNSDLGKSKEGKLRGRGLACGYWMNGGGLSTCDLMLTDDGTVMMNEGSADIGGTRASIAMQAAEVLGLSAEDIKPTIPDTDSIGYTGMTGGSRTTFATGYAAYLAAQSMVEQLKSRVAILWELNENDIDFNDGYFTSNDQELKISIKELSGKLESTGGPVSSTASVNMAAGGNGYAVHICDLEIDPETGKTDVVRYTAIQDVGKAIHPSYAEGQIQGGVVQGIGWALNEEYYLHPDGSMANHSFLDYRMPTCLDMPMIETIMVEVPNPNHPYGVRGVGEVTLAPPIAAASNAVKDATNKRILEQPIKPSRILKAISD
jgi:CO/xanthine dehydrogenase Mo-binding subunit